MGNYDENTHRGRHKQEVVLQRKCDVRLDENDAKMLDYMTEESNLSKSDIMRKALRLLFKNWTKEE